MPLTQVKRIASAKFPTRWGQFTVEAFEGLFERQTGQFHKETALALIAGPIHSAPPLVRIHSQCITGEAFQSLRCDCREQLHLALRTIVESGAGILIYEQQEGRGIGLLEKMRAYELQDQGLDTVQANLELGHDVDLRDYRLAAAILHRLEVGSVRLMTNNPEKIAALRASGIEIVERLSADVPVDPFSARYLRTKQEKLGHLLGTFPAGSDRSGSANLPELDP